LQAYRQVLATEPTNLTALTYSGAVELELDHPAEAVHALQRAVAARPDLAEAHGYLANAFQMLGRYAEAEASYKRALELAPDDARALNNFGTLLRNLRRPAEAADRFRRLVAIEPENLEAWLNLATVLNGAKRYREALNATERALRIDPGDARLHDLRGRCLKNDGKVEDAIAAYSLALEHRPGFFRARHNLGVALKMAGRTQEAVDCYRQVLQQQPNSPGTQYNLGNALQELGDSGSAKAAYQAAISQRPDDVLAHRALNDLCWKQGRRRDYAASYEAAIQRARTSVPLRCHYAKQLELAGRDEQAEEVLLAAMRELGDHVSFSHLLGGLAAKRGDPERAARFFDTAVNSAPDVEAYREDYASLLIKGGDYPAAAKQLDAWERLNPDHQVLWALRGLVWRLTGDEREGWLNDYDQFVRPFMLETPQGYGSVEALFADLREAIVVQHDSAAAPLEQTLREGTQTPSGLFAKPIPVVQAFKASIEQAVRRYVADLPKDAAHPLLRRNSGRFAFSGSWSVRLKSNGFHVNHVHPEGWISSACYIELPEVVKTAGAGDRAGWIKFGESGLDLGARERIAKWVRPQEGLLVLFPSYVWHGTVPFTSDDHRMTAAFDAVPA